MIVNSNRESCREILWGGGDDSKIMILWPEKIISMEVENTEDIIVEIIFVIIVEIIVNANLVIYRQDYMGTK